MGSWQRYKPAVSARPIGNSSPFDWSAVEDSITYPEFAHRARLEGTVPIEIVIDPEGAASTAFFAPYDEGEAEPNELLVEAAQATGQRTDHVRVGTATGDVFKELAERHSALAVERLRVGHLAFGKPDTVETRREICMIFLVSMPV